MITCIAFPSTLEIISTDTVYETSITELFIPKSVRVLKEYAFSAARKLEKIIFEQEIQVKFECFAFCECNRLNTVILPSNIYFSDLLIARANISYLYYCSSFVFTETKNNLAGAYKIPSIFVTKAYKSNKLLGQSVVIMENEDLCLNKSFPPQRADCILSDYPVIYRPFNVFAIFLSLY